MKPSILVATSAIAVMLCCLVTSSAVADTDDAAEERARVLEPGLNFIGWIGESSPVDHLFAAVPQIKLVYMWDPNPRAYMFAAEPLPKRMWTLRPVGAGTRICHSYRLGSASQMAADASASFRPGRAAI